MSLEGQIDGEIGINDIAMSAADAARAGAVAERVDAAGAHCFRSMKAQGAAVLGRKNSRGLPILSGDLNCRWAFLIRVPL
jgi:hypothetical protein